MLAPDIGHDRTVMRPETTSKYIALWSVLIGAVLLLSGDLAARFWGMELSHISDKVDQLTIAVANTPSGQAVKELDNTVVKLTAKVDALPQPGTLTSLANRVDQERDDISDLRSDYKSQQVEIDNLKPQASYPALQVRQPERR
jgi:hypothetical protein